MSLTIIGGRFKGRSLESPKGLLTKPTLALMRKSVFDICQGYLEGSSFLDLFACSGAMGLEAISRGASKATFVEKDRRTCKTLQNNIALLGVAEQTEVICKDAFSLPLEGGPYDIIYIDPPYPISKQPNSPVLALVHQLDESHLLSPSCLVFVEEEAPGYLSLEKESFKQLHYKKNRKFGASFLHELYT